MKRLKILGIVWGLSTLSALPAAADPIAGDVDNANGVDAVDIQLVINGALDIGPTPADDIDHNTTIDAVDVQLVVNAALGISIDADADGLADAAEIVLGTSANLFDTDSDGIGDGQEVLDGTDPLVPNTPPETFYQVTFTTTAGGVSTLWRIEPAEAATPFNISEKLDLIATQPSHVHQGPIKVAPDGTFYAFFSEAFDADSAGAPGLTIAPSSLASAQTVKVNGLTIHGDNTQGGAQPCDGGNTVVYVDAGDQTVMPTPHTRDIWIVSRPNAQGSWTAPVCISRDSGFAYNTWPTLSADGTKVLFDQGAAPGRASGTSIGEVGLTGNGYRTVVSAADLPLAAAATYCHSPSYDTNGDIVFESDGAGGQQVWRVPAAGGTPAAVNSTFTNDKSPYVLPDGRIASLWLDSPGGVGKNEIKIMDSAGLNDANITSPSVLFDQIDDIGLGCGIFLPPKK